MKRILSKGFALLLSSMFILTACSDDDDDTQTTTPQAKTLAATVAGDARFTVLLDALQRTGLDATLDAAGTYTVFAPNDAAFTTLLADLNLADLDALESALTTAGLRNVLLYHVLGVKVMAAEVTAGYVSTLATNGEGNNLSAYITTEGMVMLNGGSTVVATDISASNGVAHEISRVILPLSIYDLVAINADYSSLTAALGLADGDLDDVLSGSDNFTLFAPNNAAFQEIIDITPGVNTLAELVNALGTDGLAGVLLYHVVNGSVLAGGLSTGAVPSLSPDGMGGTLDFIVNVGAEVTIIDNNTLTADATVTKTDMIGTNGALHFINKVLLPQ